MAGIKQDPVMERSKLSDRERRVAEQALLTLRALDEAADHAEHGKGLAALEGAIQDTGFQHLRDLLAAAAKPDSGLDRRC